MTSYGARMVPRFAALMQAELDANAARKGDGGWLHATPEALLHDITWHWAKLAVALRNRRNMEALGADLSDADAQVSEFAADVANMAAMLLDRLGLLPASDRPDGAR